MKPLQGKTNSVNVLFFAMCIDEWMGGSVVLEQGEGLHVHAALWITHTVH